MEERLLRNLVSQPIFRALVVRCPARGHIHHSDRRSPYYPFEYNELLHRWGIDSLDEQKGTAMSTHRWKVAGEHSSRTWFIIVVIGTRREAVADITEP
jgi:hypothetical protein